MLKVNRLYNENKKTPPTELTVWSAPNQMRDTLWKTVSLLYYIKKIYVMSNNINERGIEVGHHGEHNKRQKETITFAAPVKLKGLRGNMAVVVNFNGNKYNAHRIIMPNGTAFKFYDINKEVKQESYQGVAENSSLADTTSFTSNFRLSQIIPFTNNKDLLRYLPDDMLSHKQQEIKRAAIVNFGFIQYMK